MNTIDSMTAYRIAKARGMAERARVANQIWSAAIRSVRDVFVRDERR